MARPLSLHCWSCQPASLPLRSHKHVMTKTQAGGRQRSGAGGRPAIEYIKIVGDIPSIASSPFSIPQSIHPSKLPAILPNQSSTHSLSHTISPPQNTHKHTHIASPNLSLTTTNTSATTMPAGFPNIRYDPTSDPRSACAGPAPKKERKHEASKKSPLSDLKGKGSDEKSLSSTASRKGLLSMFRS